MAENSKIEWTGPTINFWWGCDKVSRACKHCYAEEMGRRFGPMHFGQPVLWGQGQPRFQRLEAARAEAIAHNAKAAKKGTRIRAFVNSMSDILDEEVPIEWLAFVLETIHLCPFIDFQLLTKRPENWRPRLEQTDHEIIFNTSDFVASEWLAGRPPQNVWMGCTVETQEWADKRIPHLLQIPAKVRFLSCEPLLGPVDLTAMALDPENTLFRYWPLTGAHITEGYNEPRTLKNAARIHWVIVGGESGKGAEPTHPDWARSLRGQCTTAGVPFFFKQWGEFAPCPIGDGPDLVTDAVFKKGPQHDGAVWQVGKAKAGRLLDGREWNEFPKMEGRAE